MAAGLSFTGPGQITDLKAVYNSPDGTEFALYIIGSNPPLDEYIQTIAVDLPNGCGTTERLSIGTFHLMMYKINATQWQMYQF